MELILYLHKIKLMKTSFLKNYLFLVISILVLISCNSENDELTKEECFIPSNIDNLQFNELFRFSYAGNIKTIGLLVSKNNNSIYISYRSPEFRRGERVIKYQLDTDSSITYDLDQSSLVTKEMEIINNRLLVVGGEHINSYPLDLNEIPRSNLHSKMLTRYGTAVYNNNIYIAGGDLNQGSPEGNLILKYDFPSKKFITEAIMPVKKIWADAEVVEGKMYIFGGAPSFTEDNGTNDILIYDFLTKTFDESLSLPTDVTDTFITKCGNLIYVAGKRFIPLQGFPGSVSEYKSFLGIFNTTDNSFREVTIPFNDEGDFSIQQIGVLDTKLFVIYGDNRLPSDEFSVQVAELNYN